MGAYCRWDGEVDQPIQKRAGSHRTCRGGPGGCLSRSGTFALLGALCRRWPGTFIHSGRHACPVQQAGISAFLDQRSGADEAEHQDHHRFPGRRRVDAIPDAALACGSVEIVNQCLEVDMEIVNQWLDNDGACATIPSISRTSNLYNHIYLEHFVHTIHVRARLTTRYPRKVTLVDRIKISFFVINFSNLVCPT